jgi:hypothetical protein
MDFLYFIFNGFLIVELKFEPRTSCLQSRHFTTWATTPVHLALVILEMGGLVNYLPGWPQTVILPISAYQVASITGMSHQHLAII